MWEVVYEGDEISLFGILTYDTQTGQASMDDMAAMMVSGAKESIIKLIKSDVIKEWGTFVTNTIMILGCGLLVGWTVRNLFTRMREIRL